MNINRQYRLTDDNYYKTETVKTHICLHHTVGGSAISTFNWWKSQPIHIATPYIIDRDGTVYEVFDPKYWAHHLGLHHAKNTEYNKQTIGIELASEGALRGGDELNNSCREPDFDEDWLYAFDIDTPPFSRAKKLYNKWNDMDKYWTAPNTFRGYNYFDKYDEPQLKSTVELVKWLCETFGIRKSLFDHFDYDVTVLEPDGGIFTHTHVRRDKSDLCPAFSWECLSRGLL